MTRRLARVIVGLLSVALVATGVTVTAGAATAISSLQAPTDVFGFGTNYGYELDWSAPTNATGLSQYTANLYLASDTTFSTPLQASKYVSAATDDEDLYVEFTGLTPGTKYVGAVVADYGLDGDSARAIGDVDQAYKPFGKVRSLTVKPGNKSLTARWKAPVADSQTGDVFLYLITRTGGLYPNIASGDEHSFKLTGLKNGRSYTVSVVAFGGGPGLKASVHGRPIGAPAKPSHLKRTWKHGGKVTLSWKSKSTTAAPVTGYYVYVNGKRVKTISGRTHTSLTLKHEKKGHKYSFSVRARNAVGSSSSAHVGKKTRPIS